MRFGLYQPFNLTVRVVLWVFWALIAVSVIVVGSQSPEPNHPVGLLLLGLGLFGPGVLALVTLLNGSLWERLIDLDEEEQDLQEARRRVWGLVALGVVGLVMLYLALQRLL